MEDQSRMPAGFRFYPTEEELVGFYLRQQLLGKRKNQLQYVIPVLDIYDYNPWDLPQLSGAQCRQDPQLQEWFFFIPRQEKEARGGRPNRLTASGYWKATGSPGYVYSSDSRIIGEKRTMLFYKGRAPGSKTDWKMNEYRVIDHDHANPVLRLDFSLCRVYIRSKCIRSYDRRPSSSSSSAPGSVKQNPAIKTSSPLYHQQNHPLSTMNGDRSGSSRKNSASSDDRNAFNNNEVHHQLDERTSQITLLDGNNELGIFNIDDEPLWKWEPYLNSDEWTII